MMENASSFNHIILFDGVCNFCNSSINLIIRKDKKNIFRFAPLQSETGARLTGHYGVDTSTTDSIVYIEDEKAYTKSTAALRIARHMKGLYPMLYAFIIIPRFVRDPVYDIIARNRYKWFGKKDSCMVPTPEVRQKFISLS
jgi:predicted DCC family thiol-disulfide oxidoreductase YuxK